MHRVTQFILNLIAPRYVSENLLIFLLIVAFTILTYIPGWAMTVLREWPAVLQQLRADGVGKYPELEGVAVGFVVGVAFVIGIGAIIGRHVYGGRLLREGGGSISGSMLLHYFMLVVSWGANRFFSAETVERGYEAISGVGFLIAVVVIIPIGIVALAPYINTLKERVRSSQPDTLSQTETVLALGSTAAVYGVLALSFGIETAVAFTYVVSITAVGALKEAQNALRPSSGQ